MSNKTLLSEGTIRRFMKLAEIGPLTNPFIERIDEEAELALEQVELGAPEDDPMAGLEMGADPELEVEPDMDMEEPDLEEPDLEEPDLEEPDMDVEGEEDPMETLADELKSVIVDKLEDMIEDGTLEFMAGEEEEEIDLEDEELEDEEEIDLEDEELEDEGEELEDEEPEEEGGFPEELEEATADVTYKMDGKNCVVESGVAPEGQTKGQMVHVSRCTAPKMESKIVAEVARRVTKRILSSR